jgi:penicillin amidase
VRETIWGPVIGRDHRGRLRALRWIAHDPEAADVDLGRLEAAGNLDEALEIAAGAGAPPQNFVCADSTGRIGWTILGRIPRRFGHDGRLPASWADGSRGWDGWLEPAEYPRIADPEDGLLWTANSRVVDGDALRLIGDGAYADGARARQIRDALRSLASPIGYEEMRRIQLDDRALFLERWQALLFETLTAGSDAGALRPFVESWGGRAATDSVGYRAVRAFRAAVARRALLPLVAPCREASEACDYLRWFHHYEGPLWQLVSARPRHLLDSGYASWPELFAAGAGDALAELLQSGPDLSGRTWGERNTALIQHPLSLAVPALDRWLDMPHEPLPGDSHMPRVQSPTNGASERFAVSPGREQQGYLHMPTGQSGHFLSPFYASDHRAWVEGRPTPFLPGETRYVLTLEPR